MIAYFENGITQTETKIIKPLESIYNEITSSKTLKQSIENIRAATGEKQVLLKKKLPYFTPSAKKRNRANDNFKSGDYTGFICLDFDKIGKDKINEICDRIKTDLFNRLSFISPSGEGVKIIIETKATPETHKDYCQALAKYYKKNYGLDADKSCFDISRACFLSFDENASYNANSKVFQTKDIQSNKENEKPPTSPKKAPQSDLSNNNEYFERSKAILRKANAGARHLARLKAFRLLGGFVAGGLLDESAYNELLIESDAIATGGKTNKEELKTCKDAFRNGLKNPISEIGEGACYIHAATGEIYSFDFLENCIFNDERGHADYLRELYFGKYCFNTDTGEWFFYNGKFWEYIDGAAFRNLSHNELKAAYMALLAAKQKQKKKLLNEGEGEGLNELNKIENAISRKIKNLNKIQIVNDSVKWLTGEVAFQVQTNKFNLETNLFNLQNGTYNFTTGELQSHNSKDLINVISPAIFDSKATAQQWLKFVNEIFCGDLELIEFMQIITALWLTGNLDAQNFYFLFGEGANGKSTFINAIANILGRQYATVSVENFIKTRFVKSGYDLAESIGARLITTSEIPDDAVWDDSLLKDISGGDLITIRKIYAAPISVKATFAVAMIGNSRPIVRKDSHAFWRRFILIPFLKTFEPFEQINQSVLLNSFKSEYAGIFNWIREGYKKHLANNCKLILPEAVTQAVSEYRDSEDSLKDFINDYYEYDQNAKTLASDFKDHFTAYLKENNLSLINAKSRTLYRNLKEKYNLSIETSTGNKLFIFGLKKIE